MENNENNISLAPSNIVANIRCIRFAKIFSNLVVACSVVLMLAMLASILIPVLYGIAIILAVLAILIIAAFTLGLGFLLPGKPLQHLWKFITTNSSETTVKIANWCFKVIPYVCYLGLACSLIAIIMFSISKQKGKLRRIILVSIMAVVMAVILIIYYAVGGKIWQN